MSSRSSLRIVATFSQLFLISHPEIRPFLRVRIALFVLSFSYKITETQEKGSPARLTRRARLSLRLALLSRTLKTKQCMRPTQWYTYAHIHRQCHYLPQQCTLH